MRNVYTRLLAVMVTCAACAPDTMGSMSSSNTPTNPGVNAPAKTGLGAAGAAASANSLPPIVTPPAQTAGAAKGPGPDGAPGVNVGAAPAAPPPAAPPPAAPPAAPPPAAAPPAPPPAGSSMQAGGANTASQPNPANASGGSTPADLFCNKYGDHCGYGMMNRHADRAACITDFNATPAQQPCKNMHIDTAIAGTAAACNGMPSEFCFAIHCLHAAGITDQTGVTYCK